MDTLPVIDMWTPIGPVPELTAWVADNFPDDMLGYLRVFWKQTPTQEMVRSRVASIAMSEADILAALDAAGVTRALITAS